MKRTILVTGGNRGIGREIVKQLSEDKNNTVLLGMRSPSSTIQNQDSLQNNVHPVVLNLSNKESVLSGLSIIAKRGFNIDVLINNAGILHEGNLLETSFESINEVIFINTLSPLLLMKQLLPKMVSNGYGRVVNISSGSGLFHEGLPGPFSYAVSKSALNSATLKASLELPENVKINAMSPGWVKTDMGGTSAPRSVEQGAETAVWLANLNEDGPSGLFFRDCKPVNW